jgi:hypothetical protein
MNIDEDNVITMKDVILDAKETDLVALASTHEYFMKENTQSVTSMVREAYELREKVALLENWVKQYEQWLEQVT